MIYPELKKLKHKTVKNNAFGGIENKESVKEGCFFDMENLSGDFFPLFCVRKPRAVWTGTTYDDNGELKDTDGVLGFYGNGITGAASVGGNLCYCSSSNIFVNGQKVSDVVLRQDINSRSIVPFGKNIFIVPDGEYVKENYSGYVSEHTHTYFSALSASFSFCDEKGNFVETENNHYKPDNPEEGERYVEAQGSYMYLYEYTAEGVWEQKMLLYAKISASGIGGVFNKNDLIYVPDTYFENGECTVVDMLDADTVIVSGILLGSVDGYHNFVAEKKIPLMDFAVEHNNRIWGCRYGSANNGNFVNEIYASALGDPTNWDSFEGTSMDSFRVSLGCSGEFTGVGVLGNDILFFKEEYIIRVSGETPSDFSVTTITARGVQSGCHHSVVNLNERIYYKSRYGVMVYDGTFPVSVSEALGTKKYTDAVAGGTDNKYYIAMTDDIGRRSMFVFNTSTGQWYREDDVDSTEYIFRLRNCLYFICRKKGQDDGDMKYYSFNLYNAELISQSDNILSYGNGESLYEFVPEEKLKWYAETGKLGEDALPDRQILRRLLITLTLKEDAHISVFICPDTDTEWKKLCFIDTPAEKAFTIPVNTPPCHSYRLRFEGKGECRIHSLVRQSEITGEVKNIG